MDGGRVTPHFHINAPVGVWSAAANRIAEVGGGGLIVSKRGFPASTKDMRPNHCPWVTPPGIRKPKTPQAANC